MLNLLRCELKRTWIQLIRYPTEIISGIAIISVVFYGLFLSAQYMAGPISGYGERLDSIVVGYVLWTLALYVVNDIANNIQGEARTGTLEQVFLSPFGAPKIFFARAVASVVFRIALIAIILQILIWMTGSELAFPFALIWPMITLLLATYGFAFVMGSAALVFKQVQQVLPIFNFLLLFLLAAPTEEMGGGAVANLLPMLPSTAVIRALMARNEPLDGTQMLIALANGLVYFAIGLLVFRWAEQQAKQRGILGGY
ncbi:MAG: ABC transporter permease [Cyanobacteria bacterium P01_A01_bin.105]